MSFTGDPRNIRNISVTPFEKDEGLYGVSYDTIDGWHVEDLIGSKAEAEAVVQKVRQDRRRALPVVSSRH